MLFALVVLLVLDWPPVLLLLAILVAMERMAAIEPLDPPVRSTRRTRKD